MITNIPARDHLDEPQACEGMGHLNLHNLAKWHLKRIVLINCRF